MESCRRGASEGAPEGLQIAPPGHLDGAESRQVRGPPLHVEQAIAAAVGPQQRDERDEREDRAGRDEDEACHGGG